MVKTIHIYFFDLENTEKQMEKRNTCNFTTQRYALYILPYILYQSEIILYIPLVPCFFHIIVLLIYLDINNYSSKTSV